MSRRLFKEKPLKLIILSFSENRRLYDLQERFLNSGIKAVFYLPKLFTLLL